MYSDILRAAEAEYTIYQELTGEEHLRNVVQN